MLETQEELQSHQAEHAALVAKQGPSQEAAGSNSKGKGVGKPDPNRKYVLLSKTLPSWGKVPRQQEEIARIISSHFEVGVQIPEPRLFEVIQEQAPLYHSLAGSVQSPVYLFRYYRSLRHEKNHAGFLARGFMRIEQGTAPVPASPAPVEVPADFMG